MKLLSIYFSIQLIFIGYDINFETIGLVDCITTELPNIDPRDDVCGGNEWFHFKDEKCFKIIKQFATHDEADNICKHQQTNSYMPTLVSIKSLDEQEQLSEFVFNKSGIINNVWIGVIRKNNKFLWDDGSNIEFENWHDDLIDDNRLDCSIMLSGLDGFSSKTGSKIVAGKWDKVSCEAQNYIICQKLQAWSTSQFQQKFLDYRKELENTKQELNNTKSTLNSALKQLNDTKAELVNTKNELVNTMNSRFEGVEGAFMTTFEVGKRADAYYPVAFDIHHENLTTRANPTTPLIYDIFRTYYEKLPNSELLNDGYSGKGMSLTLKLLCSNGGWDGNSNTLRVLLHYWSINKAVAKIHVMDNQDDRLFVWLRGGNITYHIRSPIDLSQRISVYYDENAIAHNAYISGNTTIAEVRVSPIAFGKEDPNLVKQGAYDGWGF